MEAYANILLGSLPTEQIRPSIIGLHRDPPTHETVRTSNKDTINECCVCFDLKLPSEILPVKFERLCVDVVIAETVGYTVVITAP